MTKARYIALYTAKPWEACDRRAYNDFHGNSRVICGEDKRIAVVHHHGLEEDEANTNLMTAAPEMFESMAWVDDKRVRFPTDAQLEAMRMARSKAKGEKS